MRTVFPPLDRHDLPRFKRQFPNCAHNSTIAQTIAGIVSTVSELCRESPDCGHNPEIAYNTHQLCAQSWICVHNSRIFPKNWPIVRTSRELCPQSRDFVRNSQIGCTIWRVWTKFWNCVYFRQIVSTIARLRAKSSHCNKVLELWLNVARRVQLFLREDTYGQSCHSRYRRNIASQ